MMAGGTFLEKKFPPHPLQKTFWEFFENEVDTACIAG
jgi:hypothetical protein